MEKEISNHSVAILETYLYVAHSVAIDPSSCKQTRICSCSKQKKNLVCALVNTGNMHGHMFQEAATQGQDFGSSLRLSLKGLTLTRIFYDILEDMEGDMTRSESRWSLPSQSKAINGVAGNCGDTRMEQNFWRVFDSRARANPCPPAIGAGKKALTACRIFAPLSILFKSVCF
jgi:hypothetical protein